MKTTRRKFTSDFKTRVVLEALKERLTASELAVKHQLTQSQISNWKKEFLENASSVFEKESKKKEIFDRTDDFHKAIGEMKMENDFLKKKLGPYL